jgi:hypothetical protein
MAFPNSRTAFKENCLRRLGAPVIEINVSDEQVDDRVDEALTYYWDYHFDGTEKQYYKHQITQQNKTDGYITLPDNIIGVVNLFTIGEGLNTNNLFNIRYQIALNDLYTLTNVSLVPYYMAMQHIATLEEILVGRQPIRYNRHRNRLHIDVDWNKVNVGEYVIVEAYQIVDPDTFTEVWKDRWLLQYGTALIKRQWGNNLKKFSGMMMPGGIQFNGQQIYDEAIEEIRLLEQDMIISYSLPVADMVGSYVPFIINTSIATGLIGALYGIWNSIPMV